jgi:hypothetical protein
VYVHNINKLSSSESEDEFMDYKVTHLWYATILK